MISQISDQRTFALEFRALAPAMPARLHWAVTHALGLSSNDVLYASEGLGAYKAVATYLSCGFVHEAQDASVLFLLEPKESKLLNTAKLLKPGQRIAAFNSTEQTEKLSLRSFEMATACLFDHEANFVARIFDGGPKRVADYLEVEISDHNDASLAMHTSRIASLR